MKKIIPFENFKDASATLDNGGRFYNLLTKAEDGHISFPELGRVAGVFNDKQKAVLYFVVSISELEDNAKAQLINCLSDDLKLAFTKYFPKTMLPSEAVSQAVVSSSVIITGIPKNIVSRAELSGFIMVPVSTGKAMTFVMIPILDKYHIYEIRDNISSNTFLIAHSRGSEKLPEKTIRIGGVIKEFKLAKDKDASSKFFLEAIYYSDLE